MKELDVNQCWGMLIIEELIRNGVDYFCVAPGSRSSPLVVAITANPKAKSFVHFDERGLGYHALGYASAAHKPVVLICTSGTAAANYLPAIIEASKKKLPLIVLTADRPPELRQTGAMQTIDQVGIYGVYVKWAVDMPCPDTAISPSYVLTTIDQACYQAVCQRGVVHLNCMYREPLVPLNGDLLTISQLTKKAIASLAGGYLKCISPWVKATAPYTQYLKSELAIATPHQAILASTLKGIRQGVIVVGKITHSKEQEAVVALAKRLGWPIFADIASGLRLGSPQSNIIHYIDHILLSASVRNLKFDGVIHLGGRMTSKRYGEFVKAQAPKVYVMVLDHALRNDPDHQVTLRVQGPVIDFCQAVLPQVDQRKPSPALVTLIKQNLLIDAVIDSFLKTDERLCEPRTARLVSQLIPQGMGLYLANSMPIRDMDCYADFKFNRVSVSGNRGASGIDGLIASAAGYAQGLAKPVTLMIGDVAALHDLNSLAMLRDVSDPLVVVVINNGGGGIFSFLPAAQLKKGFDKFWGTPHPYAFANAAAMFELNYAKPLTANDFTKAYTQALRSTTSTIIEVMTRRDENVSRHKELQELILTKI